MNQIAVIGGTHHNTLSMIRSIGIAGYHVDLFLMDKSNSYVSKSRYVKDVIIVSKEEELIPSLLKKYNRITQKVVLITCTDAVESLLDCNYNTITNKFIFFNAGKEGLVTKNMNKQIQAELSEAIGINIPKSFEYKGSVSAATYPCLLKPVKSVNGGKRVIICNNESELLNGLKKFSKHDVVLVQQFIKKKFEIVVLGLSIGEKVIIPGYILKHRDFDGGTLYSTVKAIHTLDGGIVDKCKQLISKINYEGLFGIEFINDGKDFYFIEANLRNDATTYSMAVAGVNLPQLYIQYVTTGKMPKIDNEIEEIQSIVEFNDLKHKKEFGISMFTWLTQYLNAKCKYYFNVKDPIPFFYAPFKK